MRVIGEDEIVADQSGINRSVIKVFVFVVSAVIMTLVGAVMAPRWSYINPNTVFNPTMSFQVVIMGLLGGIHRLWGPIFGVIPMIVVSEYLSTTFPRAYTIILGAIFLLIVYYLPHGIVGIVEAAWRRFVGRARPRRCETYRSSRGRLNMRALLEVNDIAKSLAGSSRSTASASKSAKAKYSA